MHHADIKYTSYTQLFFYTITEYFRVFVSKATCGYN